MAVVEIKEVLAVVEQVVLENLKVQLHLIQLVH